MIDGRWESRPSPRSGTEPTLNASSMALDLWRTSADSLAGRLVHWVSGDMPLDVRRFGPVTGHLAGDRVLLRLPPLGPSGVIRIEAVRRGDTLEVERSTIGGDDGPFPSGLILVRSGPATKS